MPPSPTELAREAQKHSETLRIEFELLRNEFERYDMPRLRERLAILEERMAKHETRVEEFVIAQTKIAVLNDRVEELKKSKEKSDRRYWQFVVLFVGGLLTLAINLVVSFIRK
ncbi:MAG: hypothetical protein U0871_26940 [Gemmataceae bacterium]